MSAIFGIVRFDGAPVVATTLERMARTLAHRGADARRTLVDRQAGFGHALMRITQEDLFDAQPLRAAGIVLSADVRLDNRAALAATLAIDPGALTDIPDSALLLAAYRRWGEDCVDHLLGDFAFAVWDARAETLLLVRDPMGQRGVYYHLGADFVAFASEVKALWAVESVPRRLSDEAIGRRLLLPIDTDPRATLFDGIATLPGGTVLRIDAAGAATLRRYWTPHAAPEHVGRDDAYYIDTYRRLLEEAVACRVRRLARAPGLLFSGGFDSGCIAALAGPIVADAGRRIVAVASVLAEGDVRAVRDARAAVAAFGDRGFLDIRHHVRGDEGPYADPELGFAALDDPGGALPVRRDLYALAARGGARLVMDGHGGDYTVNVRAPAMLGRMLVRGTLVGFFREVRARRRATGRSIATILHGDVLWAVVPLRLQAWVAAVRRRFVPLWRTRPINADFARSLFARGAIDPARLRQARPVHDRWRDRWLHLLERAASMPPGSQTLAASQGVELTRPFHDRRIVEFGLAIPERLQFRNGLERHLARTALGDRLPERLLRSGPGNDAEEPDLFRMASGGAAEALAALRADDRGGRVSRLIDLAKLESMVADLREDRLSDHRRALVAMLAITTGRFVTWFERDNR